MHPRPQRLPGRVPTRARQLTHAAHEYAQTHVSFISLACCPPPTAPLPLPLGRDLLSDGHAAVAGGSWVASATGIDRRRLTTSRSPSVEARTPRAHHPRPAAPFLLPPPQYWLCRAVQLSMHALGSKPSRPRGPVGRRAAFRRLRLPSHSPSVALASRRPPSCTWAYGSPGGRETVASLSSHRSLTHHPLRCRRNADACRRAHPLPRLHPRRCHRCLR